VRWRTWESSECRFTRESDDEEVRSSPIAVRRASDALLGSRQRGGVLGRRLETSGGSNVEGSCRGSFAEACFDRYFFVGVL
jgi:hypothetical protein